MKRALRGKKITVLLLLLALVLSLAACGGKEDGEEEVPEAPDVILLTDEAGLGDEAFNDACWAGCEQAAEDFGVSIYCIESSAGNDYAAKLAEALGMEPKLIICADADMEAALMDFAAQHPEQKFAILDTNGLGANVMGITFNEQEGSFLAGIAAGMTTKSRIVSFIGGEQSEVMDRFQYGFAAGVATVGSDIYINAQYTGSSADEEAARMLTGAHTALGADVIYAACGAANGAIIEAAESKGVYAIGCNVDQSNLSEQAVLCSMVKKADTVVYEAISKLQDGTFDGADVVYTLADGALAISDKAGNLTEEVTAAIETYREKIAAGELVIPFDWQSWYNYTTALAQTAQAAENPTEAAEQKEKNGTD